MKKNFYNVIRNSLFLAVCLFVLSSCKQKKEVPAVQVQIPPVTDTVKQKAILEKLLSSMPPNRIVNGRVSFLDETF